MLGLLLRIALACLGKVAVTTALAPELIDTAARRGRFSAALELRAGLEVPAFHCQSGFFLSFLCPHAQRIAEPGTLKFKRRQVEFPPQRFGALHVLARRQ